MWTIFLKFLLNLSQYCFCFMFLVFFCDGCGILAPNQDQIYTPPLEGEVPTIGLPGRFLVVCFKQSDVCMSVPNSIPLPNSSSLVNQTFFLLSPWVCFRFVYKFIGIIFFILILHRGDIIWYLSFSVCLHLEWESQGPPTLLQMALFHSLLWLQLSDFSHTHQFHKTNTISKAELYLPLSPSILSSSHCSPF